MKRTLTLVALALTLTFIVACSGPDPEPAPPCDQPCQDRTAVRALRETMKLAYNLTAQGKPEGQIDQIIPCLEGGGVRVSGSGRSNAILGTTDVDLVYEFAACGYLQKDTEPPENYAVKITGRLTQKGTLSAAPGSTTAIAIKSDDLTLTGTVYDPPIAYEAKSCPVELLQNGQRVDGKLCGRAAGFDF